MADPSVRLLPRACASLQLPGAICRASESRSAGILPCHHGWATLVGFYASTSLAFNRVADPGYVFTLQAAMHYRMTGRALWADSDLP